MTDITTPALAPAERLPFAKELEVEGISGDDVGTIVGADDKL